MTPSAADRDRRPRYVGRFAPSPTGPLHFGSLIAALASFADARAAGGEWRLRIEDVDEPRARPDAEDLILRQLERYGFEWDGPVVRQSERLDAYAAALAKLDAMRAIYACTCTRRDLESAPLGAGGERVYPGTCRDGAKALRAPHAWRVRVDSAAIAFHDRLQGKQTQDLAREVGDFVLRRSDGYYAYQLAVVVDDAEAGITDVVRGSDLLSSTARQVFLQRLLGVATQRYLHVPIAINAAGEKLSKQTRAPALPEEPLSTLQSAWTFLDQLPLAATPTSVAEFWRYALHRWSVQRLPPVAMLLAPSALAREESRHHARV